MYFIFGHLVAAMAHCAFFRFICFIVRLFISSIRAIYALKQRHAVKKNYFFFRITYFLLSLIKLKYFFFRLRVQFTKIAREKKNCLTCPTGDWFVLHANFMYWNLINISILMFVSLRLLNVIFTPLKCKWMAIYCTESSCHLSDTCARVFLFVH